MDHHSFFARLGGNRTHQTEAEPLPALSAHTSPAATLGRFSAKAPVGARAHLRLSPDMT